MAVVYIRSINNASGAGGAQSVQLGRRGEALQHRPERQQRAEDGQRTAEGFAILRSGKRAGGNQKNQKICRGLQSGGDGAVDIYGCMQKNLQSDNAGECCPWPEKRNAACR